MSAWVLLEPSKEEQTEREVGAGGQKNNQVSWEVQLKKEIPQHSSSGRILTPNVRIVQYYTE